MDEDVSQEEASAENTSHLGRAFPSAFQGDARAYRALSAAKAAWWSANRALSRAATRKDDAAAEPGPHFTVPPPPAGLVRQAWLDAFRKEARDVAAGLYPVHESGGRDHPLRAVRMAADVLSDARHVSARRRRGGATEARAHSSSAYPAYYRQNFHFQTGGWFTRESARRYEAQVEVLFSGAAGAMRRRALALLARAWRERDQRGLQLADVACGSGAFLRDLTVAFPRAEIMGVDLSAAYLAEAHKRAGAAVIQAAAERLPFADASLDAVTCVYLFHELPPKVRPQVAAELARVLKPGGYLAFADSIQGVDEPRMGRLLEAFPAFFHEPYYESYQATDLDALFGRVGLKPADRDTAFLTKAILFEKP
jgi:ubiquinone/menaquinone biosynthesis C-methylase UbiE